jgi:tol-pal system protein YbgF
LPGLAALAVLAGIFAPELVVAQSQSEAQLLVRLQEMEDRVRQLNGYIEELQNQVAQLTEQVARSQQDNELRFQALEGGAGKKTEAATQSSGGTPAVESPQADTATLPAPEPLTADDEPAPVVLDDGLGESADPLVGSNTSGGGSLGSLELDPNALGSRPLDLSLDSGQVLTDGDAAAQYKAGYDAIVRGDYAFAEDQLRQFINLYPDDPNAADATNWLGEALLRRGAYEEAADVLTTGYEKYPRSPITPHIMLRLAIALHGAGESDMGCRLFFEISKRFPNQPAAFTQKLQAERAAAQCPA